MTKTLIKRQGIVYLRDIIWILQIKLLSGLTWVHRQVASEVNDRFDCLWTRQQPYSKTVEIQQLLILNYSQSSSMNSEWSDT